MNSFDVFDTLIGRRYLDSEIIWRLIELNHKMAGFATARKQADNGQRDLYQIYDELVARQIVPEDKKKALLKTEIEYEIQFSFPVKSNMDRVQHGDMLISDMYLPANVILQIVRAAGLSKQVTLYQSLGDKRTGDIWKKLAGQTHELHVGDHPKSDYEMALQAGMQAELYSGTKLNESETTLFKLGAKHLALLLREVRLTNDSSVHFDAACNHNLPLLMFVCEYIYRHSSDRNLVFLGRDCFLLQKIYQAYYGMCDYLPFSRVVAYKDPQAALAYLDAHAPENPHYIDLISTGATWEFLDKMKAGIDIMVVVYSDTYKYTTTMPMLPAGFTYITRSSRTQIDKRFQGFLVEILNCADHGYISEIKVYDRNLVSARFGGDELPPELVKAIHKPVLDAVRLSAFYRQGLRAEMAALSKVKIVELIEGFIRIINTNQSLLNIEGFASKQQNYLNSEVQTLLRQ